MVSDYNMYLVRLIKQYKIALTHYALFNLIIFCLINFNTISSLIIRSAIKIDIEDCQDQENECSYGTNHIGLASQSFIVLFAAET